MTNPYGQNDQNSDGNPGGMPSYGDYTGGAGAYGSDPYNAGYNQPQYDPNAMNPAAAYPGAGKRLGALVIDYVILVALFFVVTLLSMPQLEELSDWATSENPTAGNMPGLGAIYMIALAPPVLWLVYRVVMESTLGKTLGKMAVGIKVVNADGGKLSVGHALLRNVWFIVGFLLFSFIPTFGFLAFLVIQGLLGFFISRNPHRQHTCDQWAKAYVVNGR